MLLLKQKEISTPFKNNYLKRINMFHTISTETGIPVSHVQAVADLLDSGATIPFIARYRKEFTGSQDEVAITAIRDALGKQRALEDRKKAILNSLEERKILTGALLTSIKGAASTSELEDIYEQYRPKKKNQGPDCQRKRPGTPCPMDHDPGKGRPGKGRGSIYRS